jgi:hypothetical protein
MQLADLIANPHRLLFVGIIFMTHGFRLRIQYRPCHRAPPPESSQPHACLLSLSPATYAPIAVGYLLASAADLPTNSIKVRNPFHSNQHGTVFEQ